MIHTTTVRERAGLLRRFPGLGEQIARAVGQMADHCHGAARVRVWADIQPERPRDPIPSHWLAWICARTLDGSEYRFPLIPDSRNARPGKEVRADDAPHAFASLTECEREAEAACGALEAQLRCLAT